MKLGSFCALTRLPGEVPDNRFVELMMSGVFSIKFVSLLSTRYAKNPQDRAHTLQFVWKHDLKMANLHFQKLQPPNCASDKVEGGRRACTFEKEKFLFLQ